MENCRYRNQQQGTTTHGDGGSRFDRGTATWRVPPVGGAGAAYRTGEIPHRDTRRDPTVRYGIVAVAEGFPTASCVRGRVPTNGSAHSCGRNVHDVVGTTLYEGSVSGTHSPCRSMDALLLIGCLCTNGKQPKKHRQTFSRYGILPTIASSGINRNCL